MDQHTSKKKKFYRAAVLSGLVVVVLMACSLLFLWQSLHAAPADAPSTPLLVVVLLVPVLVAFALFVVLTLRVGDLSNTNDNQTQKERGDV